MNSSRVFSKVVLATTVLTSVILGACGPATPPTHVGSTTSSGPQAAIDVSRAPLQTVDGTNAAQVGPAVVGANARWFDDELGAWDAKGRRPDPGFVAAAKQARLDLVRYPGGTVANLFDFKTAIGPVGDRGCQTSGGFAAPSLAPLAPDRNRFGPDEEQQLVAGFGGHTMVLVPSINQTAQDAADFVEYMNAPSDGDKTNPGGGVDWAEVRSRNGHPAAYHITYWEYGNEPYLANQRYWRATDLRQRAEQFVHGGWSRQTAGSDANPDNDGLFTGCDLLHRRTGSGATGQVYRTRYRPIALAADQTAESGPIADPAVTVAGTRWQRVTDLGKAASGAHVFTVDQRAGQIRFGGGAHGAAPPQGAKLSITYTTGRQDGFLDAQHAMHTIDPSIKICAGWGKEELIQAMGHHPYDCLGVHSYTAPTAGDEHGPFSTQQLYNRLMHASGEPTAELTDLRRRLGQQFPDATARPDIIVSEYGTLNGKASPGSKLPANFNAMLMHNLYTTSLLIGQINNGVRLSINANLNNGPATDPANRDWSQLLASPPGFLAGGRARSIGLAADLVGGDPRTITMQQPGAGGQPYPALVAAATCRTDTLHVLVVNRDRTDNVPLKVTSPSPLQSAALTTVTADKVTAVNTDSTTPIKQTTTTLPSDRSTVTAPLPSHSTNLIVLQLAQGKHC